MSLRTLVMRATVVALSLSAIAACASPTEPEDALAVTSAAPRYVRDSLGNVTITLRVSNAGQSTVYLPTCGGVVSANVEQRLDKSTWSPAALTGTCYSSFAAGPYRLESRQAVEVTQALRLTPGEYRIVVPVALSATGEANRTAMSASFSIL